MNTDYYSLKKRYFGLDIFRIISAFMVCMFHTTFHLGCNYGVFQEIASMGAVFMTGFFILSGFSLFVNWGGMSLTNKVELKQFWRKRFFNIIPLYWIVALIYVLIESAIKNETVIRTIALLPIEAIGLQSVFHSLFGVSHNGGTWFISCIIICYLFYPFLQEIIKPLSLHGDSGKTDRSFRSSGTLNPLETEQYFFS